MVNPVEEARVFVFELGGEGTGAEGVMDLVGGPEAALVDFGRVEGEGAVVAEEERADEFGFEGGTPKELVGKGHVAGGDAEFFAGFAEGACFGRLARLEVATYGRIPAPGLDVLGEGALLQEEVIPMVEYEDVHGLVDEGGIAMAFAAGSLADDLTVLIDEVEDFSGGGMIGCSHGGKSVIQCTETFKQPEEMRR